MKESASHSKQCHCEEVIFRELIEALLKESVSHAMKNASWKILYKSHCEKKSLKN